MSSYLIDDESIDDYGNYNTLKIENKRLQKQNLKLIKKLEQITCEFSKSQNKIKDMEFQNSSNSTSGNIDSFLEENKALKEDNKKLCEELKYQIEWNKLNGSLSSKLEADSNCTYINEIENIRLLCEEKMTNMKNRIQELQRQLLKSQQLSFQNDCDYKMSQIETLEALKSCKLENDSLVEKISDFEEKAKNILTLHTENFQLKTCLNNYERDFNSLKLQLDNTKGKLTQCTKALEEQKISSEKQQSLNVQKLKNLSEENKVLLLAIDELTKSENHSKIEKCDKCDNNTSQLVKMREQLASLEQDNNQLMKDKSAIENDYLSQSTTIKDFEGQQQKLREEINQLNKAKFSFDVTLKSKSNEIDNLTCQLESSTQRLEIREQRIIELTNQLSATKAEENNLTSRITKLSNKFNNIESEICKYQSQLSQCSEEKIALSKTLTNLESILTEKDSMMEQMTAKLNQSTKCNLELQSTLQSTISSYEIKSRENAVCIDDLKEKINELNYTIDINEKENRSLDAEVKNNRSVLESLRNTETRMLETQQVELNRYELQLKKSAEEMEHYKREIKENKRTMNDLKNAQNQLDDKINEKDSKIMSLSNSLKTKEQELDATKTGLIDIQEQLETEKKTIEEIENLKAELQVKCKENEMFQNTAVQMAQQVELLKNDVSDEKKKCNTLQSELTDKEHCLEKHKVKVRCAHENLEHKRKALDIFVEKHKLEQKQLIEKLHLVENERDEATKTLRSVESTNHCLSNDLKKNEDEIASMNQVIVNLKEEILLKKKDVKSMENKIATLLDHLKCSQLNVVERTREIDRLEQVVRDRSEQMELRSNQLQTFEADLESKLMEAQQHLNKAKNQENILRTELDKVILEKKKLDDIWFETHEKNKELCDSLKDKEVKYCTVINDVQVLKTENKDLTNKINSLKQDLVSKSTFVKELLEKVNSAEKHAERLTDELDSKVACIKGKVWKIRQIEEQARKDKTNFIDMEAKLKSEIKLIQQKLDSHNKDRKKEYDGTIKKLSSQYETQKASVKMSVQTIEKLRVDLDEIQVKLYEKEEHIAELKMQINTQASVMTDMENNCRLKEVVIERLLQKINSFTLLSLSNITNVDNSTDVNDKTTEYLVDVGRKLSNSGMIYEDISLPNLLARINIKLNSEI